MGHTRPVQLDLPFLRAPAPDPGERSSAIDFVRMRRARRYIIRVRPDGSVRVTVPRGGSRGEAARFLETHRAWIGRERARLEAARVSHCWRDGGNVMLRGEPVLIQVSERDGRQAVRYGGRYVTMLPGRDLRASIEADLRRLAKHELGARLAELAAAHRLTIAGLSIRNQRSRWGSCAKSGRIALNYRLVQMPPVIRDYVLIHELMHLAQPNHSRRFWRLVEQACPDFRDSERWLKTVGRGLL